MSSRWRAFLQRSKRGIGSFFERRSSLSNPSDWLLKAFLDELSSVAGVSVTPLKAMGVATIYSIVRTTARTLSTLPLKLIQTRNGQKALARDHQLFDLVTSAPNDFMTAADFLGAMEGNRTLRGNAFAQIVRTGNGVQELIPLQNSKVRWRMTDKGPEYHVDNERIPFNDILHLKDFTETGLYGVATSSHIRDVIGLAIALQDNAAKFFANGSKVADVLATDASLSPDKVEDIATRMRKRKERGEEYSTLVLDAGLKYIITRGSNSDAQMLEARKLQREEIAAAYGIPASKAGILDHATFSNIEQLGTDFVVSYLQPICIQWEQAMNQRLLTSRERQQEGLSFKFSLQGLMRGDAAARSSFYHAGILDGWLTRNEVRQLEDLNSLEGLDEPLVPLNMLILDHLGRPVNPDPRSEEPRGYFPMNPKSKANGHRHAFKTTA